MDAEDIKLEIKFYLTLDDQIQELMERKNKISRAYYASNSLTGCMPVCDTEVLYHRAETTEQIALKLWSKDIALRREIDGLKQKQRLFRQCMGYMDVLGLQRDSQLGYVTETEQQAYEAICEVAYYLEEHRKTKERANEPQQVHRIQLLSRIKELAL